MKSNHRSHFCFAYLLWVTALLWALTPAHADSEVLKYNGHLYQRIDSRLFWEGAQALCQTWNGHLVTIGSSAENEFVFDNFVAPGYLPWYGGTNEGSDWRWVTGEPWSYTNWWPGQPSNESKNYLTNPDHRKDVWDDVSSSERCFVCEWDTEQPERILNFAQFGTGEQLKFDLVLVNPARAVTATGTVHFWDPNGNQLDSSGFFPGGVDFELPPRGTKTFSTTGAGDVVTGSITVHANLPVAGVVRFFLPKAGLAGVGSSEPQGAVIVPVRREGRLSSGVAIRNVSKDGITVDLTLEDEEGQAVVNGTAVRQIPVNGRVSEFIHEYFPDADTASFKGSMLIEVRSGQAAVIGLDLEVGGENPQFATLPVKPVTHEEFLANLIPRRPEAWSSKVVVSKTAGTNSDSSDLTTQDTLYVDYAVLNQGRAVMAEKFQTELLIDGVVVAGNYNDPPLEPGGWVIWQDRSIGKLSAGTHSITVLVHGVVGSGDYTDSEYTKFITVRAQGDALFNGKWSGTTQQQRALSFEVEEGQVTLVTLDVNVQGTSCAVTITGGIKKTPGALITDGSFTWSDTRVTESITLSGAFSSATNASGKLKVTSHYCQGTVELDWSAAKQ